MDVNISEFGAYAVIADRIPPRISPVEQVQWTTRGVITFRLSDNLSGVATYRGAIDGQYVLFEMDGKTSLIKYKLDSERLSRGAHTLSLTVTDACGNQSIYETKFQW